MMYAVIQEGGSTGEYYLYAFGTKREADSYRRSASDSSYRTTPAMKLPEMSDDALNAVGDLVASLGELDYP